MGRVKANVIAPEIAANMDHWEAALEVTGWFAGPEMTVADIMMSFPVEAAGSRLDFGERPSLAAYLERIHARPAYRRALERGGPYAYA